jgi:translation initiation factor IF-2
MSKIRINELARELEVKPNVILDFLPEIGVTDKKTHSSSIEDEIADRVRRHFGHAAEAPELEQEAVGVLEQEAAVAEAEGPPPEEAAVGPAEVRAPSAAAGVLPPQEEPGAEPRGQTELLEVEEAPETAPVSEEVPMRRRPQPLRPPLAGKPAAGAPAPAPPKTIVIPAKPVPPPKPGQILSGPRQPLPPGVLETERPTPAPPPARPAPPPRAPVRQPAASRTEAQSATPSEARGPLAGQPAARPVVPPRPDLVARLAQQAKATPGQPSPRPGMPARGRPTPVPGQPIYRGPIRPGQPLLRGPGAPAGGRTARGRTHHPTSPVAVEPAGPLPSEPYRRHQTRPSGRSGVREREREQEGKLQAPIVRRRSAPEPPPPIDREITVSEGITVKELSEKLGVKANMVIKKLVERRIFATINQALDAQLAEDISRDFGASTNRVSYEEEATHEIEQAEDVKDLIKRAPVVTIMGHVDHGKTSLLDAIRLTNVAEREAGGITQHIGAYHVEKNGRKVVFIDTPGHEAFTRMRARGAKVTDIVVLVVAADDGVMPQTLEAIDHAKAAKVPIIVAINKIDKPDAQIERIKQQLADRGLLSEDWGGDTVTVPVSAKAKTNLDLLLEMILLVADMNELKGNPDRPAVGTVLEAQLDKGRGPVATVLVRNGTLRVGDYFICGSVFGKVRAMFDDRGQATREAEPSMPVEVLGLDSLPEVGDTFQVVTDTAKAKQIVIYREAKAREQAMSKAGRVSLDQLHEQLREGETKELNVILKADVGGTAEVLSDTLQKLSNDNVKIRVMHSGVGAVTESDVLLASASDAIIIGFNVRPDRNAAQLAEQEKVDIRLHTVIYEVTDEVKRAMTGMLEPVFREVYRGRAEVRETFRISKVGTVAGCMVQDGMLSRDSQVRVLRDSVVVHTGKIEALKRFKNDVSEVKSGFECGVSLVNFGDFKPGDVIEAFVTERVAVEALV